MTESKRAFGLVSCELLWLICQDSIRGAQLNDSRSDARDVNVITGTEPRSLKPVSREANSWLDELFPEVANCLDFQHASGLMLLNLLEEFRLIHILLPPSNPR